MRLLAVCILVVLCVTACAAPAEPSQSPVVEASSGPVSLDPPRINRARGHLPSDYETADIAGPTTPVSFWGFGPGWTADPPQCAALADPIDDDPTPHGWAASGAGGIVYALAAPAAEPGAELIDHCGGWEMSAGNTTGTVTLVSGPAIPDAVTIGMATAAHTVVEGGGTTTTQADTYSAYLGAHVVAITVVTDPGLPDQPPGADLASALLVKTVSEVRD